MAFNHPYRLRSLKVNDFKSIQDANIRFHPLSILVGANSSGKSSLLQVILAVSQAVRSRSTGTVFPLNGEYARFGRFGETARFQLSEETPARDDLRRITIQATLSHEKESGWRFVTRHHASEHSDDQQPFMDWYVELVSDPTSGGGLAKIDTVCLSYYEVAQDGTQTQVFGYRLTDLVDKPPPDGLLTAPMSGHLPRALHSQTIVGTTGSYVEKGHDSNQAESPCDAIVHWAAMPTTLYRYSSFSDAVGYYWWRLMNRQLSRPTPRKPSLKGTRDEELDLRLDEPNHLTMMVESAANTAREVQHAFSRQSPTRQWGPRLPGIMPYLVRDHMKAEKGSEERNIRPSIENISLESFLEELAKKLQKHSWAQEMMWISLEEDYGEGVRGSSYMLLQYFDQNVKYLGPLRIAPQVLYNPRLRDLDLGLSGEYTAAILHANAKYQVVPISGADVSERVTLQAEVDYWLRRFGLATRALLEDRGRLGIGLQITPMDSEQAVDLTAVGVGVSQVLPVIVLCLLSEPGDLIILEQPELHLHPALQQQLGDFLLDCASSGRQMLVETHSEHLVNRVRRRVADISGSSEGLAGLIFAEHRDGVTKFRASEIDPYGGAEDDWPEGFFDVSAREAQAMVSASLTKRHRKSEGSAK